MVWSEEKMREAKRREEKKRKEKKKEGERGEKKRIESGIKGTYNKENTSLSIKAHSRWNWRFDALFQCFNVLMFKCYNVLML